MDDALVVRGRERVGDGRADRENPVDAAAGLRHELIERLPLDQLHREEMDALGFFDREDRDDARMIEGGQGLGLAAEALQAIRRSRPSRRAAP